MVESWHMVESWKFWKSQKWNNVFFENPEVWKHKQLLLVQNYFWKLSWNKFTESPSHFWKLSWVGDLKMLEIESFEQWKKAGAGKSWRPVEYILANLEYGIKISQKTFSVFWEILNTGSISIQKHKMNIWSYGINIYPKTWNQIVVIWGQYLRTKYQMILASLIPWNQETDQLWNQ